MARKHKRNNKLTGTQQDAIAAQRRIDREEYFAQPGATPTGWMGGPHTVTRNRAKYQRRPKHRSRDW